MRIDILLVIDETAPTGPPAHLQPILFLILQKVRVVFEVLFELRSDASCGVATHIERADCVGDIVDGSLFDLLVFGGDAGSNVVLVAWHQVYADFAHFVQEFLWGEAGLG